MNIKINDKEYSVENDKTILDVLKENNIKVPTLCFLKNINEIGACRVCVVEIKDKKNLAASCVTPVSDGMEIYTDSDRVINSRKETLKLILENHDYDCINCKRNNTCELQKLVKEYDLEKYGKKKDSIGTKNTAIIRNNSKCILCNRCVSVCEKFQGISVIGRNDRGIDTHIGCEFERDLSDVKCVKCGQCINICPTGALYENDNIELVKSILSDKTKHTIVAPAPAVRASLGEEFNVTGNALGKMVSALRKLGFNKVYDINITADLTIMEEVNELLEKLNSNSLPLFTSCCPAWVNFVKLYCPNLMPYISTCKSPQQMFGAIIKTYYANKYSINKNDIKVVTIMPCTAKKDERLNDDNIDAVLTTRELARLIKENNIDFRNLEEEACDPIFSEGHSIIFGASGGVMETALRTAKEVSERKESPNIDFIEVRGMNGIKEAHYQIKGIDINVAVVSGLKNAKILIDKINNNECNYQFIEVMACPGGCINGGGQPIVNAEVRNSVDYRLNRVKILYELDKKDSQRRAYKNSTLYDMYKEYLEKPGSNKAEDILHTIHKKTNDK